MLIKRHRRRVQKIVGTPQRPRLYVFKSLRHVYVQVIDDQSGKTIVSASSLKIEGKKKRTEMAEEVGRKVAEAALQSGIQKVVMDRGQYRYGGVLKKVADTARSVGLQF